MEQTKTETQTESVLNTPTTPEAQTEPTQTLPNTKLEGVGLEGVGMSEPMLTTSKDAFDVDVLTPEPAPVVQMPSKKNSMVVVGVVLLVLIVLALMYMWGSRFVQAPVVETAPALNVTERPQLPVNQEKNTATVTSAPVYENPNTPTPEALSALSSDLQKDTLADVDVDLQSLEKEMPAGTR